MGEWCGGVGGGSGMGGLEGGSKPSTLSQQRGLGEINLSWPVFGSKQLVFSAREWPPKKRRAWV